jgi:hypothetical protein
MFQKKYEADLKEDREIFDNKYKSSKDKAQARLRDLSPEGKLAHIRQQNDKISLKRTESAVDFRDCDHGEQEII